LASNDGTDPAKGQSHGGSGQRRDEDSLSEHDECRERESVCVFVFVYTEEQLW
jgi:hypothetical protein